MQFGFIELVLVVIIIGVVFLLLRLSSGGEPSSSGDKEPAPEPEKEKPKFTILFGSQSGTSESFAEELSEEAVQFGLDATVTQLEEFDFETELEELEYVVFLVSTYGEGEPTDDAVAFYDWLCGEEHEEDKFSAVTYMVFALGNRQYEHFCNVGKKVHKIMAQSGARALMDCATGDDDGSMDDDFAEWKKKFWKVTKEHFGLDDVEEVIEKPTVPFTVEYVHHPNDKAAQGDTKAAYDAAMAGYLSGPAGFQADEKFQADVMTVAVNRELRQDTCEGNTCHLELTLPSSIDYTTADNLGVFAHNDHKLTGKLVTRLGLHPKTKIIIKGQCKNMPQTLTAMDALLWYCDHSSVPRSGHLKNLSAFCSDELQKAKLLSWASGELKTEYTDDKKNWLEVLEECPAIDLPFDAFLYIVPKLTQYPRYYTISSSSKANPRHVSATVTVSDTHKPRGRVYQGICSTYIKNLSQGSKVCGFIKASSFRLPSSDCPVIMVGPGTGVAPFRAFWQEAKVLKAQGQPVKDWHLFFGCRYRGKDWIYKEEMEGLADLGIHTHLAFSRDGKEKVYVQNLMEDTKLGSELWTMMKERQARIFVCGGTSMGRSVKDAFTKIATDHGGLSSAAAGAFIKQMVDGGNYIQELWS